MKESVEDSRHAAAQATLDVLLGHRSIRKFEDGKIPRHDIERAMRAGQMASTSSSVQAYAAIHVTDEVKLEKLVEMTGGQTKVARCGAFFVICGDSRRHRLLAERRKSTYDTRLEGFLVAAIDAALFAQNVCIAFEAMGYGICYIGGLRNDLPAVDELLNLPEGVYPLFGLCAGVPAEDPMARPRLPVEAVLFENAYPDDETALRHVDDYDAAYQAYLTKRGAEPRTWSEAMDRMHATARRDILAKYYQGK